MNRTATSAASPLPPDLARPRLAVAKSPEKLMRLPYHRMSPGTMAPCARSAL